MGSTTTPVPRSDLEERLGAQFRNERKRNRVLLRDLAKALGVSVNTVRWHEYGARLMRADLIVRSAQIIGVDPCALIDTRQENKETNDA